MQRYPFALAGVSVALAVLIGPVALSQSRRPRVPDGTVLFAYTTDEQDPSIVLTNLTCSGGECSEASAVITACDSRKAPPRRSLIVDSVSTRRGQIAVSADRKGDRVILTLQENSPFAKVSIRLVVKIDPDFDRFASIEDFSGVRLGGSGDPKKNVVHLKRLSPTERNLPPCGLKLLENDFEFAQP